jgi:formiminotetrahydrofolate cyclodeaminase
MHGSNQQTTLDPPIRSLLDLDTRARSERKYRELAIQTATALGANVPRHALLLDGAMRLLKTAAVELGETAIIEKTNALLEESVQ